MKREQITHQRSFHLFVRQLSSQATDSSSDRRLEKKNNPLRVTRTTRRASALFTIITATLLPTAQYLPTLPNGIATPLCGVPTASMAPNLISTPLGSG